MPCQRATCLLDEFKETEGNPSVKARIRRLQRQVRRRRMFEDLKRAAVVITNPKSLRLRWSFSPKCQLPSWWLKDATFWPPKSWQYGPPQFRHLSNCCAPAPSQM